MYICVCFFQRDFFFPMFSDSKCALFATGVLPGLFALPGSCPLHGCRKTPSGGKWSLSRKDPKYQWKISKYGRVFGFHLDDIFQVVCDWEFSPERSPLFSWNVLQNDLLHNLCYIVLASELSRKSGHPSCRNWSLLSCLVSFLATHDHRTRSGSSRVKEPHAMKCFWTHSNWTAMEMAVKARKQSVWNFFSLVSQVGTWNFSCGGRAQHYMEDEFQSLRAEIKKMQTLLKAAKPHGHQAATKTIVDTEIQNPPWALEVSWKGPDQVTKWQKNRNEKVFCAKLLWIATKMLWTFIWNSNLTDDWNLGVLNKSNTELRRTHEVNQPKRSEKWMEFTAPSNLHVFQSDGVQSHFMR